MGNVFEILHARKNTGSSFMYVLKKFSRGTLFDIYAEVFQCIIAFFNSSLDSNSIAVPLSKQSTAFLKCLLANFQYFFCLLPSL